MVNIGGNRTANDIRAHFNQQIIHTTYDPNYQYGYYIPYLWNSYPHILTVTYYDYYNRLQTYEQQIGNTYASQYGQPIGQVTGRMVMSLTIDDNGHRESTKTAYYYDDNHRIIEELSFNEYGGTDHKQATYNFAGQPLSQDRWVTLRSGERVIPERYCYEYDHSGRATKLWHGLDNIANRLVAEYRYDELGREQKKLLGNGIESVSSHYDIQGRLTELGGEMFKQWLSYNGPMLSEAGLEIWAWNRSTYYGGDIAAVEWKRKGQPLQQTTYAYDSYGRLSSANINRDNGSEYVTYDANGNITYLSRFNDGSTHYSKSFTYNGNQLYRTNYPYVYYAYDANGNMVTDGLRGMSIQYNPLNLPENIVAHNSRVSYGYLADGRKREKTYFDPVNAPTNVKQHYRGSVVYNDDGTPDYVLHPEGMAKYLGNTSGSGTTTCATTWAIRGLL